MQRTSYIQFISLALSTSQCWPISCRNCGYIVRILSCLPRWHRTVDRHQVDIVSTSYCLHHRHCRDRNVDQQRGEIVCVYCMPSWLHRRHCIVDWHRANIISTPYLYYRLRCIRLRNICNVLVNNVNSLSVQHHIQCDVDNVDNVNVKEISTKSII